MAALYQNIISDFRREDVLTRTHFVIATPYSMRGWQSRRKPRPKILSIPSILFIQVNKRHRCAARATLAMASGVARCGSRLLQQADNLVAHLLRGGVASQIGR